jgi:hypothetical protein
VLIETALGAIDLDSEVSDLTVAELLEVVRVRLREYEREGNGAWQGDGSEVPGREFARAVTLLEEAQMRAARGIAKLTGRFAPADVERGNVARGFPVLVESEDGEGEPVVRTVMASDEIAALMGAKALFAPRGSGQKVRLVDEVWMAGGDGGA